METVLSLPVLVGLLVVFAGLVLVACCAIWSMARGRPAPVRVDDAGSPSRGAAAAVIAVAVERADGVAGLGRHDERRCAY